MFNLIVVWFPITMTLKQINTYVVLIDKAYMDARSNTCKRIYTWRRLKSLKHYHGNTSIAKIMSHR